MKIVGQPLGQYRVEKFGPPVQVTGGEPGALTVHVGAVDDIAVAGSKGDSDVGVNGSNTVVLNAQVVVAGTAL